MLDFEHLWHRSDIAIIRCILSANISFSDHAAVVQNIPCSPCFHHCHPWDPPSQHLKPSTPFRYHPVQGGQCLQFQMLSDGKQSTGRQSACVLVSKRLIVQSPYLMPHCLKSAASTTSLAFSWDSVLLQSSVGVIFLFF